MTLSSPTASADSATDLSCLRHISYAKDTAVNPALTKVLSGLGVQAEAFLEDLELDYPDGQIDCYSSGALFVRDQQNTVVAIVLFGDAFRNEIGLRQGFTPDEIEPCILFRTKVTVRTSMLGSFWSSFQESVSKIWIYTHRHSTPRRSMSHGTSFKFRHLKTHSFRNVIIQKSLL